ncbi:transcriptional regulator, TetR family [Azotobacter beijerinckii]|uniref:Transcriptional regulator, TetR family n=1 Tax=Azotobacter beijerinckii TaxID=170623 RepID=A0A1H9DS78_9GAMM|nr:TetR/AcrR family transcriptional regulator [Azotobacter beijerinckii]SEQ16329.1 transcriptional regulator, TetR family [Azotobacter beijerinckii]
MSRGRPRTFDPEQLLDQAMQVFWQRGYEATSLQDLLAATGLSKSSLYQSYPSKRALFEAALRHYCVQRRRELRERLQAAPSPREFLRAWLLGALEEERVGETPRGCMLVNVASEFSQADPEIAALLRSGIEGLRQLLGEALQRAQACGELEANADVPVLAGYLLCVMSGLRTQRKAGASAEMLQAAIEVALSCLR